MQGNNPHGIRQKKHVRRKKRQSQNLHGKRLERVPLSHKRYILRSPQNAGVAKQELNFSDFSPNPFNHRTHYMCSKALYTSNSIQREAQQSFCGVWRPGKQGDAHCLESTNICLTQLGSQPPPPLALQSTHSATQPSFLYWTSLHGNLHLICKSLYFTLTLKVIIL